MEHQNHLISLILAGGMSSRMGEDKALITWQGQPMLYRVYQVAAECTEQVYLITPWRTKYQSLFATELLQTKLEWIDESEPGAGPLIGFYRGLTAVQEIHQSFFSASDDHWVLLLGCDLPDLNTEIIKHWRSHLNTINADILAAVPYSEKGWEPLCGFYRCRILPELTKYVEQGGRSFQKWLKTTPVIKLPVGEKESKMLKNYNTPLDFLD
jgi:molybdopterin-guanine dinucleotide biosynthesis protein A